MIYFIAGVVILVILLVLSYVKAPPTEAIVVTGAFLKKPKVVSGRGTFVIPVLQRADRITMRVIKTDVKTPETGVKTKEGVPLWIDSVVTIQVYSDNSTVSDEEVAESPCKTKAEYIQMRQQAAIANFLGAKMAEIDHQINDTLQGNLREIVAEMTVDEVLTKRKEFAGRVIENARPDLAKLGLEIVTFNIQDIQDAKDSCGNSHGVVEAIGVQREMEVKRNAEIARAQADRDIQLAKAKAEQEANEGAVQSQTAIAENNNRLALRRAELKAEADRAAADAEAAGQIQKQVQEKTLKERTVEAEIAEQEKGAVLAAKKAEVRQNELDADVKKKADAEKYRAEAEAEAERIRRQKEAEAALYEAQRSAEARKAEADAALYAAQKEAEGIRAKGEAEAAAIRAKAVAEAEGIERKAEAQQKMGEASKMEMLFNAMPGVAHELASTLQGVDNVTMYGTDASSEYIGKTTQSLKTFFTAMSEGTGINLGSIVGGALGARAVMGKPAAPAAELPAEAAEDPDEEKKDQ